MLPRRLRLSRNGFEAARGGQRLSSTHFSLIKGVQSGCAAVVSKKVAKRAVDRHLLKRRILAVLSPWCSQDHSFIVYARAGSPSLPYRVLTEELTSLIKAAL